VFRNNPEKSDISAIQFNAVHTACGTPRGQNIAAAKFAVNPAARPVTCRLINITVVTVVTVDPVIKRTVFRKIPAEMKAVAAQYETAIQAATKQWKHNGINGSKANDRRSEKKRFFGGGHTSELQG
jgi:hypothetical protein